MKIQKTCLKKVFFDNENKKYFFRFIIFLFQGKTHWDVTIYRQHVLHCVEKQPEGRHHDDLQAQGEQEQAQHGSDQVMD